MELDCYRVEVVHYLNPHLIWVEVINPKEKEEFVFEQIGIYGLLPYETTIDINEGGLKGKRCPDWVPASTVAMEKYLSVAKKVFFRPIHIDERSSIFDNNIHKYGELTIETKDQVIELSSILLKSGFAIFDICLFHQELRVGNLKTKLKTSSVQSVIDHLIIGSNRKDTNKKKVIKHTEVFQAAHEFETSLTIQNLEKHNNRLHGSVIDKLIENKMKDFDKCKDIEEESLGRAFTTKFKLRENNTPSDKKVLSVLKKKSDFLKSQQIIDNKVEKDKNNDTTKVLLATKQCLEANSNVLYENIDSSHQARNTSHDMKIYSEESNCRGLSSHHYDPNYTLDASPSLLKEDDFKKAKKYKKASKVPDYDPATEKRVAYGPPGVKQLLPMRIVPKIEEFEPANMVSGGDEKKENKEVIKEKELFEDVDSNVSFVVTNNNLLKAKLEQMNNNLHIADTIDSGHDVNKTNNSLNSFIRTNDTNKRSKPLSILQKKLILHNKMVSKNGDDSFTSSSDTTNKDTSSEDKEVEVKRSKTVCDYLHSDDDVTAIIEKINTDYNVSKIDNSQSKDVKKVIDQYRYNNPFSKTNDSIFVDKLITPVIMVHSKVDQHIKPYCNMRDVYFNPHVHGVLKNILIERPMMIQMMSWPVILRGYSLFMISPLGSGKTLGYLPAVCSLVSDSSSDMYDSVGPVSIIVCATSQSVFEVDRLARMFMGEEERVLTCYAGVDELHITTLLLNGCELFICTPSVLVRLLQHSDFAIDLRRLSTFVLDDCETLADVYPNEIKYFLVKIKEMYKHRANKEHKVQFVAASRVWCDFMGPLAKTAPNSVICIGAFQECVLYSKSNIIVDFVKKENKINHVFSFMDTIDSTKKVVIVCRSDDEVSLLAKELTNRNHIVFSCDNRMNIENLYNLSKTWSEYQEPLLGPILICCDGNLTHLNVTDAHYLIHYSLPPLFSMFCKRFSVINDNYPSLFSDTKKSIKVKVFFEENNIEQLPKVLNFVKRCTKDVPELLNDVCKSILQEKDRIKAKNCVPICDGLLTLGECPDYWNCKERHAVLKEYDEPQDWMPRTGVVTLKILHYHSAVHYSARLLANTKKTFSKKYPQTYSTLSFKMGLYYSKDDNRRLLGTPKVGDICAVSVKQNFFARCQVLKILSCYNNGTPHNVLINLIDEEKLERTQDICLFYLPKDLREIETYVVHVRLAGIAPRDNDVTFSELAKKHLKTITDNEEDLYLRGQVILSVGNCVFVETLDACQELTCFNETVVRYNYKRELLDKHAINKPTHLAKIKILCHDYVCEEEVDVVNEPEPKAKVLPTPQWAHLDKDDLSVVYFASAVNPNTFFVRLTKFESCMKLLIQDAEKYMSGKPQPMNDVNKGDIVLAKFPDDEIYERARVDDIIENNKVKCFFVDQGDWREVSKKDIFEIPANLITQMPFQAIECRLVGVRPVGDSWSEFGTNWFCDICFETDDGELKELYLKYFTRDSADHTDSYKYGVAIIDMYSENDIIINKLMIEKNLASEIDKEINFFDKLNLKSSEPDNKEESHIEKEESECSVENILNIDSPAETSSALLPVNACNESQTLSLNDIFIKKPIRSVPLVDTDSDSDLDKFDIVNHNKIMEAFKLNSSPLSTSQIVDTSTVNKTADREAIKLNDAPIKVINENIKEIPSTKPTLGSDKMSSFTDDAKTTDKVAKLDEVDNINQVDPLRKPKLVWRQNKSSVTLKIQLIGAENYNCCITERYLEFSTYLNDTNYGFKIEFYGVVDSKDCYHNNKGQYILVKLVKIMKKNWLSLTRDVCVKKWIVYDVDNLDASSDEEDELVNPVKELIKHDFDKEENSDSDDEDFLDDYNFDYKRD